MPLDARDPAEHAHPAAQPLHDRLDLDDVPGVHRASVPDALDAHEVRNLFAVLRLHQNQNRADLSDRFGQHGGRQDRRLARLVRQIALVQRDVLDADNALVRLELGDAIDEQKRVAVRQDALNRRIVEGQCDVHGVGTPVARQRPNLQV